MLRFSKMNEIWLTWVHAYAEDIHHNWESRLSAAGSDEFCIAARFHIEVSFQHFQISLDSEHRCIFGEENLFGFIWLEDRDFLVDLNFFCKFDIGKLHNTCIELFISGFVGFVNCHIAYPSHLSLDTSELCCSSFLVNADGFDHSISSISSFQFHNEKGKHNFEKVNVNKLRRQTFSSSKKTSRSS